ncbi:MAG TPA: hypothetical protein VNS63_19855, partial [Blastocatellia bacterium]|nr:hypothetical protein [Blastocatellia bacterium]
ALTRLTVDGGSILDPVTGGAAQNFSTESIQEFQISTFSFDLSTGITSVGAVNIISRTGTNAFHGNAFLFYRDHSIAALPTFGRPNATFDPFFRRYQWGGSVGGPIKKDKAFFFFNYEKLNQKSAESAFITGAPVLAQFNSSTTSPYDGYLLNLRGDFKINDKNNVFGRFSRDDNSAFAPNGTNRLPSNWRANTNKDNNLQGGLTTVLNQNMVNDVRFNYQRINNTSDIPSDSDCPASNPGCIGVRGVQIQVNNSNLVIGNETNAPQNRILDRYQTTDNFTWAKGSHRFRFGAEWEHNYGKGSWDFFDPALIVLHDPRDIEATNAGLFAAAGAPGIPPAITALIRANLFIPIPASLQTNSTLPITIDDLLGLSFIAGVAGVGDKVQPPSFHQGIARQGNRYRFYGQDSWLVKPGFTFSYGLSYQYETNLGNSDLDHPAILVPLVGTLGPSKKDKNNFAPSAGFAWDVKNDGKTVIRGGAGIYYDTILFVTRLLERPLLGPAGDGRLSIPTAFFVNTNVFPRLPPLPGPLAAFNAYSAAINPAIGQGLDIRNNLTLAGVTSTLPSKFTGANLLSALGIQVPALQNTLNQGAVNGFSSIQFVKSSQLPGTLLDPELVVPYSEQFTIGFQRQLPYNMTISADFVQRNRVHNTQGLAAAIDYNHFLRSAARGGPVLPKCSLTQAGDPTAICANGPIFIINSVDRNRYRALLVKVDKRFSNRYQFTASYALSSLTGYFLKGGTPEDADHWFASNGPLAADATHRFTFSGLVNLPWGFQASLIAVYASTAPFNARVGGTVDLDGDGQGGDTLPGLKINDLGRGTGKDELFRLVNDFNTNVAKPSNGSIRPLILPTKFDFGDNFQSEDIRIQKTFKFKERYQVDAIVEVFNVFNIANLGGFSPTLDSTSFDPTTGAIVPKASFNFGQPTLRLGQGGFGTGAPRAYQFAGRFTF